MELLNVLLVSAPLLVDVLLAGCAAMTFLTLDVGKQTCNLTKVVTANTTSFS